MRYIWAALGLILAGCNADDSIPRLSGEINGHVWFMGPVAEAPVRLHRSDASGRDLGVVVEVVSDAEGRYAFRGLEDEAWYLVRAELSGLGWRSASGTGAFPEGDGLAAAVGLIRPYANAVEERRRTVSLTPFSTLVVAAAAGRQAVNREAPLAEAQQGAVAWLGFDPAFQPVGDDSGAVDDGARLRLLLDGFDALADRIAAEVGIQPGSTFNAPDLLRALIADARGQVPAGVFDGVGPEGQLAVTGAREHLLSAATLQVDLRSAIDRILADERSPWSRLDPRDVSALRARLTCSDALIFPPCTDGMTDQTAPQLVRIDPDPDGGAELSGERLVTLEWHDAESVVDAVELERLSGPRGAVLRAYPADPQGGDRFGFTIDTREVLGESVLYLRARATNSAGLTSDPQPFRFPVRNVGPGILDGVVFKGPAENVAVRVEGQVDGDWRLLAETITSSVGRFSAALTEYQGPLRITAHGREADGGSFYFDEARAEPVRWSVGQQLSTLLPFYDPTLEQQVTVSPLGDLAMALAEAWSRQGEEDLFEAYNAAALRLGRHFGFEDPVGTLTSAEPVDPLVDAQGISDAVRYTVALSCLAEQAHGLGCEVFDCSEEDLGAQFTALHLLEMYREDAKDGVLDGRVGGQAVTLEFPGDIVARMPADPLRHALTVACARWLGDLRRNGTGVSLGAYGGQLQDMSLNTDERLFGGPGMQREPRPFDAEGPSVRMYVEPIAEAADSLVAGHEVPDEDQPVARPVIAGGEVLVRVVVQDDAGVATDAEGEPQILVDVLGELEGAPLSIVTRDDELGVQRERHLEGRLDTTRLGAHFEGQPLRVRVRATDLLGQTTTRVFAINIDRAAPVIVLDRDGPTNDTPTWHTNLRGDLGFTVQVQDASNVDYHVTFADEELASVLGERAQFRAHRLRLLAREEGSHTLTVRAIDPLGRETVEQRTIAIDRTPPSATLQPAWYRDESLAYTERAGDAYRLVLPEQLVEYDADFEGAVPIRKIQTRLDPEDGNLPVLRYQVEDAPACAGCPHSEQDEVRVYLSGDPPRTFRREGAGGRALSLSAPVLGFDPFVDIPNADVRWRARITIEDRAGNQTEVQSPEFALYIIPPPPHIERLPLVPRPGILNIDDLNFAGLRDYVEGDRPLRLARWRITNPWPVAINYFIPTPGDLRLEGQARVRPERADDLLGDGDRVVDDFGRESFFRVEAGCLAGPDGTPDPTQIARFDERRAIEGGRPVRVISARDCEPDRASPNLRPTATQATAIGLPEAARIRPQTGQWQQLQPAGVEGHSVELVGQQRSFGLDLDGDGQTLADYVASPREEHRYAIVLDLAQALSWNEPFCAPDFACPDRGWWLTRRVAALNRVSLSVPEETIEFAAQCVDNGCVRRAHFPRPLMEMISESLED